MATLPDRKTLASMRRADLQKLCKDRGLKANLKSEELIDLLLETAKPMEPPRPTVRSSSMRVVSRPGSSTGIRGRVGSMIVHETDDEADDLSGAANLAGPSSGLLHEHSRPSTRKKAKETQYKLGVGRPTAIGGTGPRAITTSAEGPRSKRAKGGPSVQPAEHVIREEEEDAEPPTSADPAEAPLVGPSHAAHQTAALAAIPPASTSSHFDQFRLYVSEMVEPLRAQLRNLDGQLQQATSRHVDVDALRSSVAELSAQIAHVQAQDAERDRLLDSMKAELAAMRLAQVSSYTRMEPGVTAGQSGAAESNDSGNAVASSSLTTPMSPSKSSLGKRHRESNDTGNLTAAETTRSSKRALRPQRKKAKLDSAEDSGQAVHESAPDGEQDVGDDGVEATQHPTRPGFTVFSGPEEPPAQGNSLDIVYTSDLFAVPAATPPNGSTPSVPTTSTANGAENQAPSTGNAFSFSFANSIFRPMTSTPAVGHSPGIPRPEPPTSPTPAGPSGVHLERSGGRKERNDLFHPHGPPRPSGRPSSRAAESQAHLAVSAAGPSPEDAPEVTLQELFPPVRETLNVPANDRREFISLPDSVHVERVARTYYGTEAEWNTRFEDFGIEGVAMRIWGATPR